MSNLYETFKRQPIEKLINNLKELRFKRTIKAYKYQERIRDRNKSGINHTIQGYYFIQIIIGDKVQQPYKDLIQYIVNPN